MFDELMVVFLNVGWCYKRDLYLVKYIMWIKDKEEFMFNYDILKG